MRKAVIGVSILIVAVILLISTYFISRPKYIVVQGVADADEVRISSRVPGRVDKVFVHEGEMVKTGQVLVTIDAPDLRAKAVQADAARRAASAQEDKAFKGARPEEIEAAFNLWQKAIVGERVAKQTNVRVKQLYTDGVVSAQQRDEAQARYDASKKDRLAAEAQYHMALKGARTEDKQAASALTDQASGAVMEVESYIDDTVLSSPIDGEVSVIVLKSGELAGSGTPLITVTDLSDVYFVFNIREDLMPDFKMGTVFKAYIPATGSNAFDLKVTYIAPRGDFATWSATKTSGQFDMRTFEVRAYPVDKVDGLRPGMSAVYNLPVK